MGEGGSISQFSPTSTSRLPGFPASWLPDSPTFPSDVSRPQNLPLYSETIPGLSFLSLGRKLFCGSLFLRIDDFLYPGLLIFAIVKDWFFLLGINFCGFRNVAFN